ncbi:hypothetical protein RYX36_002189 [Vicia faba]
MSEKGILQDRVPLAETLATAGVRSPQVSVLWGTVQHIWKGSRGISLLNSSGRSNAPSDVQEAFSRSGMSVRKLSLNTPAGRKVTEEGGGHREGPINNKFPIQIEAPIKRYSEGFGIEVLRQPLPSPNDCRPADSLVNNIHPNTQAQMLVAAAFAPARYGRRSQRNNKQAIKPYIFY